MEPSELPESEMKLLHSLKLSDESAFNILYKEHSLKLFSVAYNATKSSAHSQEIVQEIFVSLWINRKSLLITSSIRGYLLGAVRNKAFDFLDKQIVRDRYKQNIIKTTSIAHNTTEESIAFQDLNIIIKKEIEVLPPTTRNIFVLSRLEGFSNSEIAKEYSFSIKAVEYHLTKALKHLRLHLKQIYILLLFSLFL